MQFHSLYGYNAFCGNPSINLRASSYQTKLIFNAASMPEAQVNHGLKISGIVNIPVQCTKGANDRIKEALLKVDYSVSSFDTAWVAMIPSPRFPKFPCFPECINWILDNQHRDGSWGLPHCDPSLGKDSLCSTLACILALRQWNVGEEHVRRGLHYIGSNFSSSMDKQLQSPNGFDIIFPGMIGYALGIGLDLPMRQADIDTMLYIRDLELKSLFEDCSRGAKAYCAYIAEGLREFHDWKEVMKYQKKNGSLFNSPATTAAAVIHTQDEKALNYLRSLLHKFGNSVPTIYPLDIFTHLCIIDDLERLGISRHFIYEMRSILDRIYRCWVENDEEITSDVATCAMAFRILRINGYDISSDALAEFGEVSYFNHSVQGYLRDVSTVLELYKASQVKLLPNEAVLESIESWSRLYLEEYLTDVSQEHAVSGEVDYTLKFPFYANLERLEHKRNIENFSKKKYRLLKTSYINRHLNNEDVLKVALDEFVQCQSIYRKELEHLESWVKENKLDQLEFARQKLAYCYLSAAATLFPPEMSDARLSWVKNSVLTTVVDDFFDVGGSREELSNLIMLVEMWDGNHEQGFRSKQVEIVFSALYSTISELGVKASTVQHRSVTGHIIEIWLNLMKSMLQEDEWTMQKSVPTVDEYMENAYVSFALGPIILPALYFVGPKLSEDIIGDFEYHILFKLVSTCGRLLNDMRSFEREHKEGKLNALSLRILHGTPEDEAKREMERIIDMSRRELLRLVLQREASVVPRACKEIFWKMNKVLHLFYMKNDGFTSPKEMVAAFNAVIHDPLQLVNLSVSKNY